MLLRPSSSRYPQQQVFAGDRRRDRVPAHHAVEECLGHAHVVQAVINDLTDPSLLPQDRREGSVAGFPHPEIALTDLVQAVADVAWVLELRPPPVGQPRLAQQVVTFLCWWCRPLA